MRLYHSPETRSNRVLWTLEEIGAPYELTFLTREERRRHEHRQRHPLGRVPVMEFDDGTCMFESAAICLHLGDLYPTSGMVPAFGSPTRAAVLQWTFFAMTELEPATLAWARARRAGRDEAGLGERFEETAAGLDRALAHGPWLLGEGFSVADVICAKITRFAFDSGLIDDLGGLRGYVDRAHQRPASVRAAQIDKAPR